MLELKLSRYFSDGKFSRLRGNSLDSLFVESSLIDNLSDGQLARLRNCEMNVYEILSIDYLIEQRNYIIDEAIQSDDITEVLSHGYSQSVYVAKKDEIFFSTPQKILPYIAYCSFIKSDESNRLLKTVSSRADLKSLLLFEYLFQKLSERRKNSLTLNDIDSATRDVSMLYLTQKLGQIIALRNDEIEQFCRTLESKKAKVEFFGTYRELSGKIPEGNYSSDIETSQIIERRNHLLLQCSEILRQRTNERMSEFEKEYSLARKVACRIKESRLPNAKEIKYLKIFSKKSSEAVSFCRIAGIGNLPELIEGLNREIETINQNHNFYSENINSIKSDSDILKSCREKFPASATERKQAIQRVADIRQRAIKCFNNPFLEAAVNQNLILIKEFYNLAEDTLKSDEEKEIGFLSSLRKEIEVAGIFKKYFLKRKENISRKEIEGLKSAQDCLRRSFDK